MRYYFHKDYKNLVGELEEAYYLKRDKKNLSRRISKIYESLYNKT